MAEDINRVVLVGRLTRDAELMYTNTGFAITKMGIAVNRRRKQGDQWVDEANFFDVQLFGKRGESLSQYLGKGQQVAIEGQLRQDRWEQEGMKRSRVYIEASNIQLLGSRNDRAPMSSEANSSFQSQPQGNVAPRNSQPFESYSSNSAASSDRFEDDIPF